MSARRAVITGVSGQDGSYLAEMLVAEGCEVIGLDRHVESDNSPNLAAVRDSIDLRQFDLGDHEGIRATLEETRPDEIYHLAAPSFVPDSWVDPTETVRLIAAGTGTVLASALALDPHPRLWVAASSEVFGDARESPQDENSPMRPRSPYGVAKLAALGLVRTMREHHGLFASTGVTYNHESPRRPPHFLPRKVTRGAAAIALGQADELVLGDLDAVRDWSDARDVVRAARLAMLAEEPGDYVIASGVGRTVRELVEVAFAAAGKDGPIERYVRVDPELVRPPEPTRLVGDASHARSALGWEPEISFAEMIGEMVRADMRELSE
jgi:GDPmannose 4,6-dehydratase